MSRPLPTTWPRCRLAQRERGRWHSSYVSSPFPPSGASPCPFLLKAEIWHRGKPKTLRATISSPWLIRWSWLLFSLNYRKCSGLCKGWPHDQGGSNAFLSSLECSLEPVQHVSHTFPSRNSLGFTGLFSCALLGTGSWRVPAGESPALVYLESQQRKRGMDHQPEPSLLVLEPGPLLGCGTTTWTGVCDHRLCIFCLKHSWALGLPAAAPLVLAGSVQTLSASLRSAGEKGSVLQKAQEITKIPLDFSFQRSCWLKKTPTYSPKASNAGFDLSS